MSGIVRRNIGRAPQVVVDRSARLASPRSHVRATGTGFAIGVGRGGAALSPMLVGILFESGMGLQAVAIVMASEAAMAAAALLLLPKTSAREETFGAQPV